MVSMSSGESPSTNGGVGKKRIVVLPAQQASCLEGLKASELTMIHRLAGNDPLIRKKTMKKLRKWLMAIVAKVPDSLESRNLVDSNFVRVWKALFYCMWMADKPLPQEQLAEQISNLLSIFSSKPYLLVFFMDWFYLTVAREWPWIDRFRLDKFMMLIRRFLRKSLEQLSVHQWNEDMLTQFINIISVHIFNRYPPVKKTRAQARVPDPPTAPLGFQIHFTDIFLEELAKVGADTLNSDVVLQMLSPFIYELAYNEDDRLLSEIKERIFVHLMQQSDPAFDYMEGKNLELNDDEEIRDEGEGESDDVEKEESDDEEMDYNQPLDPRAGQVDVILPQLEISCETLAQKLVESGGQKDVKKKNKKLLFALARCFNVLTEGQYPLAIPDAGPRRPTITKKEVQLAAEKLTSFETELVGTKKRRKNKRERKRDVKKAKDTVNLISENSSDSVGSEDLSPYLMDNAFQDNIRDNYMSYMEEIKKAEDEEEEMAVEIPESPKGDEIRPHKNRNKRARLDESVINRDVEINIKAKKIKSPKKSLTPLQTPVAQISTPCSLKKKRVSFVLARNLEHPHADYQDSIERSPAIPYDSNKQPNGGLLKSPAKRTIQNHISTPRKRAADFF